MNASRRGVVLEGITGAGKSQTLRALMRMKAVRGVRLYRERETFGDFMQELHDGRNDAILYRRLDRVISHLQAHSDPFVLERFHPSYYALEPRWERYDSADAELFELGARTVLLEFPSANLQSRSLRRSDRGEAWANGWFDVYGSEECALTAMLLSCKRRREAIERSRLPFIVTETAEMNWDEYAAHVAAFAEFDVP